MSAVVINDPAQSMVERYEAVIRISTSIRAGKDPRDLFEILAHELSKVIQFDAIAHFDESANRIKWHLGAGCRNPERHDSETDPEVTLAAWVYGHQEAVVLGTVDGESRFPPRFR